MSKAAHFASKGRQMGLMKGASPNPAAQLAAQLTEQVTPGRVQGPAQGLSLSLSIALALIVTGCAGGKNKGAANIPGANEGPPWLLQAKRSVAQRLAKNPDDPLALRERALIETFYDYPKPHQAPARAKARLLDLSQKQKDFVAGYALWIHALATFDDAALRPALEAMMAVASEEQLATPPQSQERNWPLRMALDRYTNWIEDRPEADAQLQSLQSQLSNPGQSLGAQREWSGLLGKVARVRGTNYQEHYRQQGCVQEWSAGQVQGVLGDLGLSHADLSSPFKPESKAPVFPLACAMRVWNPEPYAGYRRLQSQVEVGEHGAVLEIRSGNRVRVRWDGQEIWRNDTQGHYPAGLFEVYIPAAPGSHRLEVALAIPGERSWFHVRASDALGQPLKSAAVKSAAPPTAKKVEVFDRLADPHISCAARLLPKDTPVPALYQPLVEYCALSAAMYAGDLHRAYRYAQQMAQHQGFALGQELLADFTRSRADLDRANAKALALRFRNAGIAMDPSLTRAKINEMRAKIGRGEQEQVIKDLRKGELRSAQHVLARLFEVSSYLGAGDELRAEQSLAQAEAIAPTHCKVMSARFSRARSVNNMALQSRLVESLQRCPGGRELAADWYYEHGDYDRAKVLYERLQRERSDDVALMGRRADIAEIQGDLRLAKSLWEAQTKLVPYRAHPRMRLTDLAVADAKSDAGQSTGKAHLQKAIALRPHDPQLRLQASRIGIEDPLLRERIDGMQIIQKQQKAKKGARISIFGPQQSARYLLDRDVVEVYPDGSQRHLIHQIIQVLDKEAIDQYGEISLPDGAQLLTLRSVKENGEIVDPESVAGKESYSLRGLSPGDYVEQEWLMPAGGAGLSPGRVDLGGFRFQSTTAPFLRSELIVLHPREMKLRFETKNNAPVGQKSSQGSLTRWAFVATDVPRLKPEPFAPDYQDILPQIRGFAQLSASEWLAGITRDIRWSRRRGPALRDMVQHLIRGKTTPQQKVEALWAYVRDEIDSQGNLSVPADRSFDQKKGNKATLLAAMLDEANIAHQTLVVRSRFAPQLGPEGHPQFESYDAVVLQIDADPKKPQYLVPDLEKAALGYLPPWFEGAQAYVLPLGASADLHSPQRVQLGAGDPRHRDRRVYDLKAEIDADGNAKIRGTIRLQGLDAAQWRRLYENVAPERREELVLQIEVARLFPGAALRLKSFELSPLDDPDKALEIKFRAEAQNLAQKSEQGLVIPSAPLSLNPGLRYASLPQRKLDMLIPYAPEQSGHLDVVLKEGQFVPSLQDISLESEFGAYKRKVQYHKKGLRIDLQSSLQAGMIRVGQYPRFVDFVQMIRKAEREPLRTANSKVATRSP